MSDVTHILNAIDAGDPHAAEQLLPLVYAELRRLAAAKLAHERPGQTLDATGLVHEAYLRLVGSAQPQVAWDHRGHFFAAAAEAMRRILVDRARAKATQKRGGDHQRLDLDDIPAVEVNGDLVALDEALAELESHNEPAARLVKLRYFIGMSHQEAAAAMDISRRSADRLWALARAWLLLRLGHD